MRADKRCEGSGFYLLIASIPMSPKHFKRVKHLVQLKIKISYENYLADILGVGSGDDNEGSGFLLRNFLA